MVWSVIVVGALWCEVEWSGGVMGCGGGVLRGGWRDGGGVVVQAGVRYGGVEVTSVVFVRYSFSFTLLLTATHRRSRLY